MNSLNLLRACAAFFFICFIVSCKSKSPKSFNTDSLTTVKDTEIMLNRPGHPIDFKNTAIVDTVYVTDHLGVEMKQDANASSTTLGKLDFGEQLEVIETKGDWTGIRQRITRVPKKDYEITGWEEVFVENHHVGKLSDIKILPQDLYVINSDDQNVHLKNKIDPTKYISIDLIDKEEYEATKQTEAPDMLLADTTVIIKNKGVIVLPLAKGNKHYKDIPDAEEQTQVYTYEGQIPSLNVYVLMGTYYEDSDFRLINKNSGTEIVTLEDMPHVSPKADYLVSVSQNIYDECTDFFLYKINNLKLTKVANFSFKYWAPNVDEKNKIFWSIDGYLYVPVIPFAASMTNNPQVKIQYLKIGIK